MTQIDIEKLALQFAKDEGYTNNGSINGDLWKGFIFGFNKAVKLLKEKEDGKV